MSALVAALVALCLLLPAAQASDAPRGLFERHDSAAVLVFARDVEDSAPRRAEANRAHMAYIETVAEHILVAGPLYDDSGTRIVGSVYVLAVDGEAAARTVVEADPFFAAGVWASVEYSPFLPAAGDWLGGVIW
jgi:uncharacterized protein YciI